MTGRIIVTKDHLQNLATDEKELKALGTSLIKKRS